MTSAAAPTEFIDIINERAPTEYRDDHLPAAINLSCPVGWAIQPRGHVSQTGFPFDACEIGAMLIVHDTARYHKRRMRYERRGRAVVELASLDDNVVYGRVEAALGPDHRRIACQAMV